MFLLSHLHAGEKNLARHRSCPTRLTAWDPICACIWCCICCCICICCWMSCCCWLWCCCSGCWRWSSGLDKSSLCWKLSWRTAAPAAAAAAAVDVAAESPAEFVAADPAPGRSTGLAWDEWEEFGVTQLELEEEGRGGGRRWWGGGFTVRILPETDDGLRSQKWKSTFS